jgi:hypothetical protein
MWPPSTYPQKQCAEICPSASQPLGWCHSSAGDLPASKPRGPGSYPGQPTLVFVYKVELRQAVLIVPFTSPVSVFVTRLHIHCVSSAAAECACAVIDNPPNTQSGTITITQGIAITKTKYDANKIKIRKRRHVGLIQYTFFSEGRSRIFVSMES